MIYIRLVLISLWLAFSCVIGIGLCLVRWGDSNLNATFSRIFSWGAIKISKVELVIEGKEHLYAHQPCVYIANHQSGLDMATFGAIYPRGTVLTGKKEIVYVPFFGLFFLGAGNIRIDRKNRRKAVQSLEEAGQRVKKEKKSVWIFPEGTRNATGQGLLPFKRGPFYLAVSAGIPIVPIVSSQLGEIVNWKKKTFRGGKVFIRILEPISTAGKTSADVDSVLKEAQQKMLEAVLSLSERQS